MTVIVYSYEMHGINRCLSFEFSIFLKVLINITYFYENGINASLGGKKKIQFQSVNLNQFQYKPSYVS